MPKNMLSEALREIRGLLNQLLINLEGEHGEKWLTEFKKFLRKEKCWVVLLELIGVIKIPATSERFWARERFVENTEENATGNITIFAGNFAEWFFGKVEECMGEAELRYSKLYKTAQNKQILAKIGAQFVETTLSQLFWLMEQQGNGESGTLLNNRRVNLFYIRDVNGVLRAVYVFWGRHSWLLNAFAVDDPHLREWAPGSRVFSRN